jgi:hypothetical protein
MNLAAVLFLAAAFGRFTIGQLYGTSFGCAQRWKLLSRTFASSLVE